LYKYQTSKEIKKKKFFIEKEKATFYFEMKLLLNVLLLSLILHVSHQFFGTNAPDDEDDDEMTTQSEEVANEDEDDYNSTRHLGAYNKLSHTEETIIHSLLKNYSTFMRPRNRVEINASIDLQQIINLDEKNELMTTSSNLYVIVI
jgi:hypothetical protein